MSIMIVANQKMARSEKVWEKVTWVKNWMEKLSPIMGHGQEKGADRRGEGIYAEDAWKWSG